MNNSGNEAEVSLELKLNKTSRAKYEGTMRSFNGQAIIRCLIKRWKGFRATTTKIIASYTRIDHQEGGSWITYEGKWKRILRNQGCTGVRFRSCGTVGYWPTMWFKSRKDADILHGHGSKACQRIACQLCWQQRWYQGRGTKRTIFLLVETRRTIRQSSRPSVVTGMSSTIVEGSHWQGCTSGYFISKELFLLISYRPQEG